MRSQTLKFHNLENLGHFIRNLECGYYANLPKLTIKGAFSTEIIEFAITMYNVEVLEADINMRQTKKKVLAPAFV